MALSKEAKTSLIAGISTLGVALIIFLTVLLFRYFSKKKAEGKEEVKEGEKDKEKSEKKEQNKEKDKKKENDKTTDEKSNVSIKTSFTASTEATKRDLPESITRKINGKNVVAKLGKDGRYHIDASQMRSDLQDSITSVKNSTNSSINTTVQKQEEFNRKISEHSKELDATKAKLAEQQQTKLQVDQLATAIGAAAPSVIDAVFSKLNNFDLTPVLNAIPLTTMETINEVATKKENDLPAAPTANEDLTKKETKEVKKGPATINTEVINRAKEDTLSK